MRRLAILGASGHGKVVADTAIRAGWETIAFFDDSWGNAQPNTAFSVIGKTSTLIDMADKFDGAIIAIGDNRTRLMKALQLSDAGLPLPNLVHPYSYVANNVIIGAGTVIFAGAIIQSGTSIGPASIVNTGATVDHDCSLSAGSHISPGAHLAGSVHVGECAWVGIGSTVNQNLSIGDDAIIGANAAVITDVRNGVTMVGVPANVLQKG
tara:strand:+ start:27526 stop:28152 length:627 start_codon:yes stop_codon:yes gene_type:complete